MIETYHRGEIAVQEQAGERSQAILNGRAFWRAIPAGARAFVSLQSYVAVGWLDASGDPWASLAVDQPGFAACDDTGTVVTILASHRSQDAEALHLGIRDSHPVGLLFIDLSSRRRLRVNGVAERSTNGELRIGVAQAFSNCPKYIQRRERGEVIPAAPSKTSAGLGAPADLASWLARTDTAFLASVGPDGSIDCSHRGGSRGFMRMRGDTVLVPDYPGNSMFCSLGNMAVEPRAGLVLVDFDSQQQLHLSGDANVEMSRTDLAELTGGTGRWWTLKPRKWALSLLGGATRWRLMEESPFNPKVAP